MSDAPDSAVAAPSPVILTSPSFYEKFNKVMDEFTKKDLDELKYQSLEYQKNHPILAGSETVAIFAVIIHYMMIYYYNGTVNIAVTSTDAESDKCAPVIDTSNNNNNTIMFFTGLGILLGIVKLFINANYRNPVIDVVFSVIMVILAIIILIYVAQINDKLKNCQAELRSLANARQQMNNLLGWSVFGLIVAIVYLGVSLLAVFGVFVPVYQQEKMDEKTSSTNELMLANQLRAEIKQGPPS